MGILKEEEGSEIKKCAPPSRWFFFCAQRSGSHLCLLALFGLGGGVFLTAQSLQFSFRFCFQATRDKGSNAEYASSMFMWIAKRKWGAASPNRDSFADRNLRQRLKLAFRSLYRTKKVSISHSTTVKEQSLDQTYDLFIEIIRLLLSVSQKCTRLDYFLSANVS